MNVCEQEVITTKYEETVLCLLSGFTLETTQELLEFRGLNSYEETLSEGTFLRENID